MAPYDYTVIGAGAVGLLYGTRLAVAGRRVQWVVPSHADALRRDGIVVQSAGAELRIAPDVVADATEAEPADVVVVALKTTANDDLGRLVGPAVADGATVAMFQNGLGVEDQLRAAVPQAGPILGAMCFVCAHRTAPGRCDHLDYGAVTVGELGAGSRTPAVDALVADLGAAGVEATGVDDLGVARWRKLMWNIPFNGLSVVLDASTDELLADGDTRTLVSDLMDEVAAAADACGSAVEPGLRDQLLAMTDAMTPYAPSMKLDHDAGRSLEVAAIYDAPLAAAAAAGAPMARVEVLARLLRLLDRRGRATAGPASTVSRP